MRLKKVKVSGMLRTVSKELWDALEGPKPPYGFPSNGCSLSPDSIRGRILWPACVIHDWHYSKYTPESRRQADAKFRRNLRRLIRRQGGGWFEAWRVSLLYWLAVRRYGASFYDGDGSDA